MRPVSQLDRFITAVHRRAVVVFVLERVGAAAGIVAGVSFLAVLLFLVSLSRTWSWTPIIAWMAMGLLFGAYDGWPRRPTKLAAVVEADRQLKLDDLLSSAMTAKDDDFGRTVRALAERACATLSPSAVVVKRFGGRYWGGIGVAWAVVIVLGLLAGGGTEPRVVAADSPELRRFTGDPKKDSPLTQSPARRLPGAATGSDENRNFGQNGDQPGPTGSQAAQSPNDANPGQSATGTGGGSANTGQAGVDPTRSAAATGNNASAIGETAGGTGVSTANSAAGTAGGLAGTRQPDRIAAPWKSDRWPTDRAAALQAVKDGRVPDEYRDVIRAYFEDGK